MSHTDDLDHAIQCELRELAACESDTEGCRDDHLDLILQYTKARDGALSDRETAAVLYTARSAYGRGT